MPNSFHQLYFLRENDFVKQYRSIERLECNLYVITVINWDLKKILILLMAFLWNNNIFTFSSSSKWQWENNGTCEGLLPNSGQRRGIIQTNGGPDNGRMYASPGLYHLSSPQPRPGQNGRHFADAIFKCIFMNENVWISFTISLKFVSKVPIDNKPALV